MQYCPPANVFQLLALSCSLEDISLFLLFFLFVCSFRSYANINILYLYVICACFNLPIKWLEWLFLNIERQLGRKQKEDGGW